MSDYPTRRRILTWHLKREGLVGIFQQGVWLISQPRLYTRLWFLFRNFFGRTKTPDDASSAEDADWDRPQDFCMTSERLMLRPMAGQDLDALAALHPKNLTWRQRLSSTSDLLQGWITFVAEDKETGEVVAQFTFTQLNIAGAPQMELGYRVSPNAMNRGYATEGGRVMRDFAFVTVGLNSLTSLIEPDNTASIRVAEKLGMTTERDWQLNNVPVKVYSISYEKYLHKV